MKYNIIGYFNYKGLHLSNVFNNKKRLEACADYDNFKPDDVVLMTYPKTGETFDISTPIYSDFLCWKCSCNSCIRNLKPLISLRKNCHF